MKRIAKQVALVLIALLVIAGIALSFRPTPVLVDDAAVEIAPMRVTVDEEGITRIRDRYIISSPLQGRLRRITLDPGDPVDALQTQVAAIEPQSPELLDIRAVALFEARVRASEAAVQRAESFTERARVEYEFAEAELGRIGQAAERGAATDHELEEARRTERAASEFLRAQDSGEDIARYELEIAQAALLFARGEASAEDAARMSLMSPIDGAVLRVFRESDTVVAAGEPLLEVGDPRDLEIVIDVLSTDGVRVRPGDRVIIDHWGGDAPLEAEVRLVEPSAFMKISALGIEEQRVNIIADFVSPPEERLTLGDQYRIEASIVIWSDDAVLNAPSSSVFRAGEDWAVYEIVDGRAELRRIEIGRRNELRTQVLTGIDEGASVVLYPGDTLRSGIRVAIRDGDEAR